MKKWFAFLMVFCLIFGSLSVWTVEDVEAATVVNISTATQLKSALTSSKSATYKLTKDISGWNKEISVTKGTKTLDLNGHTIKGKNNVGSLILVKGGTLTVMSSKKGGLIYNTYSQDGVGVVKGKLNIKGGTIRGKTYGVYQEGGTLTVSGGLIKGIDMGICHNGGTLKMTGGKAIATGEFGVGIRANTKAACKGIVSGGRTEGFTGIVVYGENINYRILGGTHHGKIWGVEHEGGKLLVEGGSFIGDEDAAFFVNGPFVKCDFTMTGGEATSYASNAPTVWIQNEVDVRITGGSFTHKNNGEVLRIDKSLRGIKDIDLSLFKGEVIDDTPEAKGLIATEFTYDKSVKYTPGMYISDANQLYSAFMNCLDNLEDTFTFTCSEELYDVYSHYMGDWTISITGDTNTHANLGDGQAMVTTTMGYQKYFQMARLTMDSSLKNKVDKSLVGYYNQMNAILQKTINPNMTTKQKAKAIHDYMITNYSYDHSLKKDSYEFYGPLKNKKAVCQGFATLYNLLLNMAGIESNTVAGYAASTSGGKDLELHMWNVITTKAGNKYYVDVTFDDGYTGNSRTPSTKFFYKTEKDFYGLKFHYPM